MTPNVVELRNLFVNTDTKIFLYIKNIYERANDLVVRSDSLIWNVMGSSLGGDICRYLGVG